MPHPQFSWGGSLHQTFRLRPEPSTNLFPFLSSDKKTPKDLLLLLPYHKARSRSPKTIPDHKRYRDGKQVYQTLGFIYEKDGIINTTYFGKSLLRFLPKMNDVNKWIFLSHAVIALAHCQLRNPSGAHACPLVPQLLKND